MAHPKPLQPADRAPDFSTSDASTAADRRSPDYNSVTESWEGANAAPQRKAPEMLQWAPGSLAPSSFLMAPFPVDYHEKQDEIKELDIEQYGYCFEPKSTVRVTQAPAVFHDYDNDSYNNNNSDKDSDDY
jgi:hypothetical protein